MTQEIKPCPFCGRDPYTNVHNNPKNGIHWADVGCNPCYIYFRASGGSDDAALDDALEQWNTRKG